MRLSGGVEDALHLPSRLLSAVYQTLSSMKFSEVVNSTKVTNTYISIDKGGSDSRIRGFYEGR